MLDDIRQPSYFQRLGIFDWVFALALMAGAIYANKTYANLMDGYEVATLYLAVGILSFLGWNWKGFRTLVVVCAAVSLFAVWLYQPAIEALHAKGIGGREAIAALANDPKNYKFFFKYLLSSQAAIMWMSALYFGATIVYFIAMFARSEFAGKTASGLTWSATAMGVIGMLVRWRESYLISTDVGHIPVSNLYEVFVLFAIITALMYLYYEKRYQTRSVGGVVLLVISAAVGFLIWYGVTRDAHQIQPLIPALQSWWMKLHVPANFIGYGSFALSAMVGIAYLFKARAGGQDKGRLPSLEILDDLMYKSIALGFAFFTIATVLGAMWAAEAWGGYWSWDPKETWALIVWLNYAAWLHLRLTKGLRGKPLAWWSIIGLFVTLFAFLGVNMFLSGMHSYGGL
jgi:cytochrome c-type biogenesis protein CcsB